MSITRSLLAGVPSLAVLVLLGLAAPAAAQDWREERPREALELCLDRAEDLLRERGLGRSVEVDEITDIRRRGDEWVKLQGYLRVEPEDRDRRSGTAWLDCDVEFEGDNRVAYFDEEGLFRSLERSRARDPNRRRGGELRADAREACREMVDSQGYEVADVREADQTDAGMRLEMRLRRNDRQWGAVCAYNRNRDEARFVRLEPQGSGGGGRNGGGGGGGGVGDRAAERARDACREIARNRGWREIRAEVRERRNANDRVVVMMQGRREGDSRERRCTFDTRTGEASFDDQ